MKNYKPYINALRQCAKEHENDITPFAHIRVSDLCRDTANLLEELEQEPVIDKIRSEIQEHINYNKKMNYQGIVAGLLLTLAIIDKYKGEMGDI